MFKSSSLVQPTTSTRLDSSPVLVIAEEDCGIGIL